MSEAILKKMKHQSRLNLTSSLALSVGILTCYILVIINSGINDLIDEYKMIMGDKVIVTGIITDVKEFQDEVEKADGSVESAYGVSYNYTFRTLDGTRFQTPGSNYGELPVVKEIGSHTYEVQVEYLSKNPQLHRIHGLWSNNESLWEWFKHEISVKLIWFIFCFYCSDILAREGLKKYKLDGERIRWYEESQN